MRSLRCHWGILVASQETLHRKLQAEFLSRAVGGLETPDLFRATRAVMRPAEPVGPREGLEIRTAVTRRWKERSDPRRVASRVEDKIPRPGCPR